MTATSSSANVSQINADDASLNPLLIGKGLPPFEKIEAEQVKPGIELLLQNLRAEVRSLETSLAQSKFHHLGIASHPADRDHRTTRLELGHYRPPDGCEK